MKGRLIWSGRTSSGWGGRSGRGRSGAGGRSSRRSTSGLQGKWWVPSWWSWATRLAPPRSVRRVSTTPPTPLFLLSLPRSGSTLAQRILAAHEAIATASEPWILLPYLYTLRERGAYAEYNHRVLVRAVEDF